MPTTARGTTYTVRTFTAGGEAGQYAVADTVNTTEPTKLMFFTHGHGGDQTQFTGSPTWAPLKEWLMDNGWAYCEGYGAGNHWGNDAGRTAYGAVWGHMKATINVGRFVILGRSMGGLVAYWLYTQHPELRAASGLIISAGVTDLERIYTDGQFTTPIRTAYGATTDEEVTEAIVGHNPMEFPAQMWNGRRILQVAATGDITVPPSLHGLKLRDQIASRLRTSRSYVTTGGDHNSATGGDPAAIPPMTGFMQAVTRTEPVLASFAGDIGTQQIYVA